MFGRRSSLSPTNSPAVGSSPKNIFGTVPMSATEENAFNQFATAEEADNLDDIEDHMGEDFGFGFDPEIGDPNVPPRTPQAPTDLPHQRTATSITLTWEPQRQHLVSLVIQAMPAELAAPVDPFGNFSLKKTGCVFLEVGDPQLASQMTFSDLKPGAEYIFRLVARNPRGTTNGHPSAPIMTLEYSPERGDISSFLYMHPSRDAKASRRLSFRSQRRTYVWVVLDANLLTWSDSVDGKEIGRLLMTEVKCVLSDEGTTENKVISILDTKGREYNFEAESRDPKHTSAELCSRWLAKLRAALTLAPGDFGKASNTALLM
eukprot:m.19282 g.19282  ORF g.19282 m.19282 type:complete len:318 (-) comp3420_c0_seq1:62-1015(-)